MFGGGGDWKGTQRAFQSAGNVSFLDLDAGYMAMFAFFIELSLTVFLLLWIDTIFNRNLSNLYY